MGVKPLEKPAFQACPHQATQGCGVYEARPAPCRLYRCAWVDGLGLRRDRPDRLGVILDRMAPAASVMELAVAGDAKARAQVQQAEKTVRARETRRGAFGEARVRRVLEALHRSGILVVLVPYMGRSLPVGSPL